MLSKYRLNRALSKPLTSLLLKTPLTPNHVTAVSLGFGLLSGVLFSTGQDVLSLGAALSYQLAVVLDNCDGEIARAKNLRSEFGGWFDVAADLVTDLALFLGVAAGILGKPSAGPVLLALGLCVSGSLAHFGLVIFEKLRGFGPAVFEKPNPNTAGRRSVISQLFDAIREGEASWFVLLASLLGRPEWILWLGSIHMQFIWMSALFVNFKWLSTARGSSK